MKSILSEYINKGWGIIELQNELQRLIKEYNKITKRNLFVYASDINKGRIKNVTVSLVQDDFYNIQDILRQGTFKKIDVYIETPGGSGEAAEEIAKFLRKKFSEVNFVIAGESKSAGTILVLSGDNIYMTETGSLGPIDAQVRIGRSVVSAHDYVEWVEERRAEAQKTGKLNPFDALMVAQISPGELKGIQNSLDFAKDLVREWLEKYKFKNWKITKTRKQKVTPKMRKDRAYEVANMLCDHTFWRTHGRSLKIDDLKEVLVIEDLDKTPPLAEVVYRIKTIIRLIFDSSTIYKLYYLKDFKLAKTFSVSGNPSMNLPHPIKQQKGVIPVQSLEVGISCPKCKTKDKVVGYVGISSTEIKTLKLPISPNVKDNDIFVCGSCNFAIDLKPIKNQIENQTKKPVTFK